MHFTVLSIDPLPLDADLTDSASVGPELAHLARSYLSTPRALVWRHASSDWPLLLLTLPIATRLTLLTNPVFGRLVRQWGHGIRFLGVDADGFVHDFRELLDAAALRQLIDALGRWLLARESGESPSASASDEAALDTVFDLMARDMLTVLERRRDDWTLHLARDGRLIPDDVDAIGLAAPRVRPVTEAPSLFDRRSRHPEFLGQLRSALRASLIDVDFYGRVLRSIDRREHDSESRIISILESALDPITLARLARTRIGSHLGCYNWLLQDPRVRAHRAATLGKLPAFAQFFADRLLAAATPSARDSLAERLVGRGAPANQGPQAEARLRAVARAIDSGQDRAVLSTLAAYFRVSENLLRVLWRNCPAALGAPPTWHLRHILAALDQRAERHWPTDEAGWAQLKTLTVPVSVSAG